LQHAVIGLTAVYIDRKRCCREVEHIGNGRVAIVMELALAHRGRRCDGLYHAIHRSPAFRVVACFSPVVCVLSAILVTGMTKFPELRSAQALDITLFVPISDLLCRWLATGLDGFADGLTGRSSEDPELLSFSIRCTNGKARR